MIKNNICFVVLLLFASCSTMRTLPVKTTQSLIEESAKELETERSWEIFKDATLSHLKLMEGMLKLDPNNETLLYVLIKGYSAYAMGVYETLFLEDYFMDVEDSPYKKLALISYKKSLKMGLHYLEEKGISTELLKQLLRNTEPEAQKVLDRYLDHESLSDMNALFFTAQALGGMINLKKDDLYLVSKLPFAKLLAGWVCSHDPNFYYGSCDLLQGAISASTPRMLGGDPETGKLAFLNAIKAWPNNFMNRIMYIQYYLVPQGDRAEYQKQKSIITSLQKNSIGIKDIWPEQEMTPEEKAIFKKSEQMNLLNAIALKKLDVMERFEDKIFEE